MKFKNRLNYSVAVEIRKCPQNGAGKVCLERGTKELLVVLGIVYISIWVAVTEYIQLSNVVNCILKTDAFYWYQLYLIAKIEKIE